MICGWDALMGLLGLWAAAERVDTGLLYYVGLAMVVAVVIVALTVGYRTWEEIHDVEEPDSPADLLETFRQAHAEGEIDDGELERVRRLLAGAGGTAPADRPAPGLAVVAEPPATEKDEELIADRSSPPRAD